jgi:hypothetical protein
MNLNPHPLPAAIGAALNGGFFAGIILINGELHGLVVAPKAEGEYSGPWSKDDDEDETLVEGATSYNDGMANTVAMAGAGSKLAAWAQGLHINGANDWYVPSRDELEIIYRNLKPATDSNARYGRHGENPSALPPTHSYTAAAPAQTTADAFRDDAQEAFDEVWYWTSTQHAADEAYAWGQYFDVGGQDDGRKAYGGRARAVRRFKL